jgi:hypothetical protein
MITATDSRLPCAVVTDAPARFKDLCLDATDHHALADWWCAAMGYARKDTLDDGTPRDPSWPLPIQDPTGAGPLIWIVPVPEAKTVKNRMHIDVFGNTDALLAAGATLLRAKTVRPESEPEQDDDIDWDVLADPEGNEFCVFAPED